MLRQENQQNYSQKYPISNLKTTSYLCFMFFFRAHLAVVLAQELLKSATRVNDIVWHKRTVHTGSFSLILFHKYMICNISQFATHKPFSSNFSCQKLALKSTTRFNKIVWQKKNTAHWEIFIDSVSFLTSTKTISQFATLRPFSNQFFTVFHVKNYYSN